MNHNWKFETGGEQVCKFELHWLGIPLLILLKTVIVVVSN